MVFLFEILTQNAFIAPSELFSVSMSATRRRVVSYCYSNPIVSCDEIKKVNLEAWQDADQKPDILTRTNKWIKNKVGGEKNADLTK